MFNILLVFILFKTDDIRLICTCRSILCDTWNRGLFVDICTSLVHFCTLLFTAVASFRFDWWRQLLLHSISACNKLTHIY